MFKSWYLRYRFHCWSRFKPARMCGIVRFPDSEHILERLRRVDTNPVLEDFYARVSRCAGRALTPARLLEILEFELAFSIPDPELSARYDVLIPRWIDALLLECQAYAELVRKCRERSLARRNKRKVALQTSPA